MDKPLYDERAFTTFLFSYKHYDIRMYEHMDIKAVIIITGSSRFDFHTIEDFDIDKKIDKEDLEIIKARLFLLGIKHE